MAHRGLPLTALAFASLSFGSGCPDDDKSTSGDDLSGGGDAGAGDSDAAAEQGGDAGTGAEGGTSNTANGGSLTNGALTAEADAAIQAFGATLCGLYRRCDPSEFADLFENDDECLEYLTGYYATFYATYGRMAEDPAACSAAVESYFKCIEQGYADMTCQDFDIEVDVDCFNLRDVVYTDCDIPEL